MNNFPISLISSDASNILKKNLITEFEFESENSFKNGLLEE